MDFKELRYVVKIAELQNFTKAAQELYITQPTLSHYIAKVEKEWGTALFERSTTPISLTVAGQYYVETARKILQLENNLKERLKDIATLKVGKIVMGMPPDRAVYVLPHIVARMREQYPGIELVTMEKNSQILREAVISGKADFAVMPLDKNEKELEGEIVYMEELYLVAKKGIIPAGAVNEDGVVDFEQIKEMPFVLLRQNRGIRHAVDDMFLYYGCQPNIAIVTSSNRSAYRMAANGIGLAVVPAMTLYTILPEKDAAVYHLSKNGMRWPLAFVHRKGEYLSVMKMEISDMLEELFENAPAIRVSTH